MCYRYTTKAFILLHLGRIELAVSVVKGQRATIAPKVFDLRDLIMYRLKCTTKYIEAIIQHRQNVRIMQRIQSLRSDHAKLILAKYDNMPFKARLYPQVHEDHGNQSQRRRRCHRRYRWWRNQSVSILWIEVTRNIDLASKLQERLAWHLFCTRQSTHDALIRWRPQKKEVPPYSTMEFFIMEWH